MEIILKRVDRFGGQLKVFVYINLFFLQNFIFYINENNNSEGPAL